eukprot:scaffold108950_cov32-Tisochrysis_lutea.AAC.8
MSAQALPCCGVRRSQRQRGASKRRGERTRRRAESTRGKQRGARRPGAACGRHRVRGRWGCERGALPASLWGRGSFWRRRGRSAAVGESCVGQKCERAERARKREVVLGGWRRRRRDLRSVSHCVRC